MTNGNPARQGKTRKKTKRGSVRNDRRLKAFAERRDTAAANWASVDPHRIQGVINAITHLGGAVTFGTSRDNGAYSLSLMLDGDRETLWFNGDADVAEQLRLVMETLDADA